MVPWKPGIFRIFFLTPQGLSWGCHEASTARRQPLPSQGLSEAPFTCLTPSSSPAPRLARSLPPALTCAGQVLLTRLSVREERVRPAEATRSVPGQQTSPGPCSAPASGAARRRLPPSPPRPQRPRRRTDGRGGRARGGGGGGGGRVLRAPGRDVPAARAAGSSGAGEPGRRGPGIPRSRPRKVALGRDEWPGSETQAPERVSSLPGVLPLDTDPKLIPSGVRGCRLLCAMNAVRVLSVMPAPTASAGLAVLLCQPRARSAT